MINSLLLVRILKYFSKKKKKERKWAINYYLIGSLYYFNILTSSLHLAIYIYIYRISIDFHFRAELEANYAKGLNKLGNKLIKACAKDQGMLFHKSIDRFTNNQMRNERYRVEK